MTTLRALAGDLAAGRTTSRKLVEACLDRIRDGAGEGARTFISVFDQPARLTADWVDGMRKIGAPLPPWAGIPLSLKDCFDVAGLTTTGGSRVLADAPPAARDAVVVERLRAVGFIPIGRTNMTEFAYAAIGTNPHYGTPACAWDRSGRRIPGGSTSGGAVSVADGMARAAIGTDSGGSCRIPAALNGIVGFKPTTGRVPREGVLPLSTSLDSIGPLTHSAECAAIVDAVMAGEDVAPLARPPIRGLRFGVPRTLVLDDLEAPVAAAFQHALSAISQQGATIAEIDLPEIAEIPVVNAKGGLAAPEFYATYRQLVTERGAEFDPRVLRLILRGKEQLAADYVDLLRIRRAMIERTRPVIVGFDALLMPTVPILAPKIDAVADDAEFLRLNLLLLRNPRVANFLDGCAVSIPCHRPGEAPVGLMLQGLADADRAILAIGAAVEAILAPAAR